jgi:hypothetical protein
VSKRSTSTTGGGSEGKDPAGQSCLNYTSFARRAFRRRCQQQAVKAVEAAVHAVLSVSVLFAVTHFNKSARS